MDRPSGPLVEEPVAETPEEGGEEERSTRRLLWILLVVLGLAAIALLILLLWLLRPQPAGPGAEGPAGYPIRVVTMITGRGAAPEDLIRSPLGVAFDRDGNLWISNTGQSRVDVFRPDGTYLRSVGDIPGPGALYTPYGIVQDPATGRVYVADYAARKVLVYSPTGSYVAHFPADDQDLDVFGADGFTPYDVQVAGGRIVVSSNDGLYFFDQTGHVVARWGFTYKHRNVRGVEIGMFNFPDAFVVDPESGRLYVADTLNRRVVALGPDGRWLWVSGRPDAKGKIRGFWQLPRGIELGPDGNLYVVDTFRFDQKGMGTGHIVVLSPEGELLSEFGRSGSDVGAFSFPEHIARDAGSDLWAIADRENHRVVVFRLVTPYPEVDDLQAPKYPKGFTRPTDVWATPSPSPVG